MTKGGAIVPAKAQDLGGVLARAEDLLRIWSVDLETANPEEVRGLCLAAATAIRDGQIAPMIAQLLAPITGRALAAELDELVAAFPNMRKDVDLTTFFRLLAEEVRAENPSHVAVHASCRALIRTATFPPTISDVVAAVASQAALCAAQATLLERLPRRAAEAAAALGRPPGAQ